MAENQEADDVYAYRGKNHPHHPGAGTMHMQNPQSLGYLQHRPLLQGGAGQHS